jgi:hypothetical protein
MGFPFDRGEYRIPYPPTARPRLIIGERELMVVDCSQRGLRYVAESGEVPEVGSMVEGRVRLLSRGAPVEVSGTVVRMQDGEVAVHLAGPGIPMQRVFDEQRYLARHFPARR